MRQIDRNEAQKMFGDGAQLVDVLPAKDSEAEHIPGAIDIPLKTLGRATAPQRGSDRAVIVSCHDDQ